jgi:uncharacterized protein (TIGR02284 family)
MYKHNGLEALETLTRVVADSIQGCREAAEHARGDHFRQKLERLADDRDRVHGELQSALSRRGGPDEPGQSTLGQIHQAWLDLKAKLGGDDDLAVMAEVERGEDYLKEKFETVMSRETMDEDIRDILERAYHQVCDGRDRILDFAARLKVAECQASNNLAMPAIR